MTSISATTTARRAMASSTTKRIGTALSNNTKRHFQHRGYHSGNQRCASHLSLAVSRNSRHLNPSNSKQFLRQPRRNGGRNNSGSNNNKSLSSSAPPSSKPATSASSGSKAGGGDKQKTKTGASEVVPNVALAAVLGGFVTSVFMYSMNAVGRGDGNSEEGNDPLAQLKAEAAEARDHKEGFESGRMSDDEIWALESGLVGSDGEVDPDRIITDVAVAASADIAALEEEANLKIFRKKQNEGEETKAKKKPWWRFGF